MKTTSALLVALAVPFAAAAYAPSLAPVAVSPSSGRVLAPCPDPTLDAEAWAELEASLPDEDCLYGIEPAGGTMVIIRDLFRAPHLDIRPGHCPNYLLVTTDGVETEDDGEGDESSSMLTRVPMSILGNGFDVTQVDVTTVTLTRFESLMPGSRPLVDGSGIVRPVHSHLHDHGTPFPGDLCDCHTLTGDGLLDLTVKFERLEMIEELDLDEVPHDTNVRLRVAGRIAVGLGFRISDCIRVIHTTDFAARDGR